MRKVDLEEMAKGYEEMAEINLTISTDFLHLENEGAELYEMGTEKGKGEAI